MMTLQCPNESRYPVEVSGWDSEENFFVEKTTLHWDEEGGKTVLLRSSLREGMIVFIRLSQPSTALNNFPLAYQAKHVGVTDGRGLARVFLLQLRPRREAEEAVEPVLSGQPHSSH
jgi:hypothetical protein